MSNKKEVVVIGKEAFETKVLGWIKRRTYITSDNLISLLEDNSTTITLDESIEERANSLFSVNDGFFVSLDREGLIKFATEQQIISEMKMNGWIDCKNHPPKQR